MRKPIAFALLISLLSTAAFAQSFPSQKASGSKLKWIAIGSAIGGAGLAIFARKPGRQTSFGATNNSFCLGGTLVTAGLCRVDGGPTFGDSTPPSTSCIPGGLGLNGCPPDGVGVGVGLPPGSACIGAASANSLCNLGGVGIGGSPGVPCIGGGVCSGGPLIGRRGGINWRIVGPAIGAAGAGAFVLYRNHVAKRRADLAVRPNGVVQLSYTW